MQKGSTLALKPRADVTRSPKQGYQWPHEKDLCPPKNFKKKSSPISIQYSFDVILNPQCELQFLNIVDFILEFIILIDLETLVLYYPQIVNQMESCLGSSRGQVSPNL